MEGSAAHDATTTLTHYEKRAAELARRYNAAGPKSGIADVFATLGRPAGLAVELGCGNGFDGAEIRKHCRDYVGMDYSSSMLELARAKYPGIRFECGDVRTWAIPKCDAVFAYYALVHLKPEELEVVFDKVADALAEGGVFYLCLEIADETRRHAWSGEPEKCLYRPQDVVRIAEGRFALVREFSGSNKDGRTWGGWLLRKRP